MPLNPLENMPETLRRQNLAFDKFSVTPKESKGNGYLDFGGSMVSTSSGRLENATSPVNLLSNPIKVRMLRNCIVLLLIPDFCLFDLTCFSLISLFYVLNF